MRGFYTPAMRDARSVTRLALGVATLFLLTAVGACSSDQGVLPLLNLTNSADRDVDVFLLYPDTGQDLMFQKDIRRGETSATRSDIYPQAACSSRGVLIARDKQGREVARRTGRLCPGDTWIIEARPAP